MKTKNKNIEISVVMPVFNGDKYLEVAIKSILNQSYDNFEFIIINDGSKDKTIEILNKYQKKDERIFIYSQENQGITKALNKGCKLARGKYIARMDADDISLPNRLEKQVKFMKMNPDVGILGSGTQYINEDGLVIGVYNPPITHELIGWYLFFRNCMIHPSIMIRRDVLNEINFYSSKKLYAQDYDLLCRAFFKTRIANLPEVLIQRRVRNNSICSLHSDDQNQIAVEIAHSFINKWLKLNNPINTITALRRISDGQKLFNKNEINSTYKLLIKLYSSYLTNPNLREYDKKQINNDIAEKLLTLSISSIHCDIFKSIFLAIKTFKLNPLILLKRFNIFLHNYLKKYKK